jgi:VWFA-related protein
MLAAQGGASTQQPAGAAVEQPGVTFRAEVNYVEVDARVLDAQERFVADLSAADFQVLEDGKPQQITVFARVNIPVERAVRPLFAERPVEPDVQTNESSFSGRVYLLVLDDLHTHPLRGVRVRLAARRFVERHLGANDIAAVVHTSGRADAAQDFTSSTRLLLNAIDKFMGRKLRSALLGRLEEELRTRDFRQPGDRIDDPDAAERGYHARNTLESLRELARLLEGVRGRRKALVYFSEGIDYDITDPFGNRDATTVLDTTRDAIAAATRANVAIYGIDVRGLGAGLDDTIEIQSFPDDTSLGLDNRALQNEVRLGQDSLRVLSDETGGFAVVNTNDINGAFERLVEENSSYYLLGYYPANDRRDGRFRRIEVRVSRPGLTVRARRGYAAPRGRASESRAGVDEGSVELRDAIGSPVPVGGLPLAATASAFKGPDRKASVVVSTLVAGRDLPLAEREGSFRNDLEIALVASDARGKVFPGGRNTVNLTLKPDTVPRLRAAGFRVITSIDLPPGRYQLRVAAREGNTRRAGSVLYDIEVPDFFSEPLSMSSLALTSATSRLAPTARPKDPLVKLLPAPLSSYRQFVQDDELALFAEVYEAAPGMPHKVAITLTMKAEGGQTVFQTREERDSVELGKGGGGYGFTARIPLKDIAPGLYVLRLEAESRVAERPVVARETVLRVVGPSSVPRPSTSAPAPPASDPAAPAPPRSPTPSTASAPTSPSVSARPPAGQPVSTTTLNNDAMSGIDRAEQAVVRTDAEWLALWRRHAPGRSAPEVDFSRSMVLAVFLGTRSTGGYDVQITRVHVEDGVMVVRWTERRPAPDQIAAQVMTAPSHMVTVPRHQGQVRFERAQP